MNSSSNSKYKNLIQSQAPILALLVFVIASLAYTINFNEHPVSKLPESWGQFGDYMGGIVNPIVGLITIWLLTVSLKQNQAALRQAKEELQLTRQAIMDAKEMQKATEAALLKQTEIADQTRDISNSIALFKAIDTQYINTQTLLQNEQFKVNGSARLMAELNNKKDDQDDRLQKIGMILLKEENRLISKYLE